MLIDSEEKSKKVFIALSSSFILLFIFQFFQSILGVSILPWLGQSPTANPFGAWNELGIFAGLLVIVSLMFFDFLPTSRFRTFFGIVLVLSFLLTALVNFALVWWMLAIFLIIILAYIYSQYRDAKAVFRTPFF